MASFFRWDLWDDKFKKRGLIVVEARVIRSAKREFLCRLVSSGEEISAKALGGLLKGDAIVVGDYVTLKFSDDQKEYYIIKVHERRNSIYRIIVRENKKKITASNCDLLVILSSVSRPTFKRGIVDRFLVRAYDWNITPLVVFNKMDEYNDNVNLTFERDRLKGLGVKCFEISAHNSQYKTRFLDNGMDEFKKNLSGNTSIFVGQSGVGKSKVISVLSGGKINLKSMKIGRKSRKGIHTTTWTEMVEHDSLTIIDSPGIRSFSLDDISKDELINYFPDLSVLAVKCKFNGCKHDQKAQGCAFFELDDSYESELILSRLESYKRILNNEDMDQ